MFVDINVSGEEALQAQLLRLDAKISAEGLLAFMEAAVEPWVEQEISMRFADERSPDGSSWEPLSPYTQADREQSGYGPDHPILRRTGELFNYLTSGGDKEIIPGGVEIKFPRDGASIEEQQKFSINQAGGTNIMAAGYPAQVPARPMIGWTEPDLMMALELLSSYIWDI